MAMSVTRAFKNVLPIVVRNYRSASTSKFVKSNLVLTNGLTRQFTRSMWCLTKRIDHKPINTVRCSCCGLHTEGDKELAEFLTDEINLEKESQRSSASLPTVKGFSLEKSDECEIAFVKKDGHETVRITFNVNNAIDEEETGDYNEQSEAPAAELKCKPPFVVEINKGGDKTLHIQCQFPHQDIVDQGQGEEEGDLIEITDVTLLRTGEEWGEKSYTIQGGMMDGNLYDMLLNMMEERGVDVSVVDQLVNFSTVYEHRQYIQFLENLKEFAGSK